MGWFVLDDEFADVTTDEVAQSVCPLCRKECGYGNKLYSLGDGGYVHAVCQWEADELENRKKKEGR